MASIAPLIVIAGPTASGKSSLALELAQKWGGEIICADSRTVYRDMDIGTAKPSKAEQKAVPHWLLDIVTPGSRFTVADFQRLALEAIDDIRGRGKIPFLVGGTGLYIDAIVLSFVFGPDVDYKERQRLEGLSIDELLSLHSEQQIGLPENIKNKRYLVRNIEKNNTSTSRRIRPDSNTKVFAISIQDDALKARIHDRIQVMFENNIVYETQQLLQKYIYGSEAMTGNVYKIVEQLIEGKITQDEAERLCETRDWQLARRQKTWLRRHDYVLWGSSAETKASIESILRKYRDA